MVRYLNEELLKDPLVIKAICMDMEEEDYWSDAWSKELYIAMAWEGMLPVSLLHPEWGRAVPFCQMQKAYGLLDWENLHISHHVRKILKHPEGLGIRILQNPDGITSAIQAYHGTDWLCQEYVETFKNLCSMEDPRCLPVSVGLYKDSALIAGEIGYQSGGIYTSLSGFSSKKRIYANFGTLQLVLLGRLLEKKGFAFWNLGHPYMDYKIRLGARILKRPDYLFRWYRGRILPCPNIEEGFYDAASLMF